jgi:hypothetical protein
MTNLFALLSLLLAGSPGAAAALPPHPVLSPSPGAASPDVLFSRRALRRARLLIQMRLLQLREERLECVRQAILQQLPPDLRPDKSTAVSCRKRLQTRVLP